MSQVQVTVNTEKEVTDILNALLPLVADIVAKKPLLQMIADSLPLFITAVSEGSAAATDFGTDLSGSLISAELWIPQLLVALKPVPAK
jgi:hypothetical protein